MSKMESSSEMKEPYENAIKIKHNNFWYVIPENEFVLYWLPNVPKVSKMAGLKRGKYYSRFLKEMDRKGSGKYEKNLSE